MKYWPDGTPKSENNAFTSHGFVGKKLVQKLNDHMKRSLVARTNVDEHRKRGVDLSNLAFLSVGKPPNGFAAHRFVINTKK